MFSFPLVSYDDDDGRWQRKGMMEFPAQKEWFKRERSERERIDISHKYKELFEIQTKKNKYINKILLCNKSLEI